MVQIKQKANMLTTTRFTNTSASVFWDIWWSNRSIRVGNQCEGNLPPPRGVPPMLFCRLGELPMPLLPIAPLPCGWAWDLPPLCPLLLLLFALLLLLFPALVVLLWLPLLLLLFEPPLLALPPPPNARSRLSAPLRRPLCSYDKPVNARYLAFNCPKSAVCSWRLCEASPISVLRILRPLGKSATLVERVCWWGGSIKRVC